MLDTAMVFVRGYRAREGPGKTARRKTAFMIATASPPLKPVRKNATIMIVSQRLKTSPGIGGNGRPIPDRAGFAAIASAASATIKATVFAFISQPIYICSVLNLKLITYPACDNLIFQLIFLQPISKRNR